LALNPKAVLLVPVALTLRAETPKTTLLLPVELIERAEDP
jgi:hypothetical protein